METIVDDDVYEWASKYKWRKAGKKNQHYAGRSIKGCSSPTYLHREILGLTKGDGKQADHINGNSLDNRRVNLRVVTNQQNSCNRIKSGKFKGVTQRPTTYRKKGRTGPVSYTKPWVAQITLNYQHINLGYFSTPEEAAHAYDKAAKKYFGEFARLNFPNR